MARPVQNQEDFQKEVGDRLRRIETRLTRFMEWSGFDTEVKRCKFDMGNLDIPTDATSLRDILQTIPEEWGAPVNIYHKGDLILTIRPRQ